MASKETTEVIDLPINEKFGLSIKEASAFFGIGIKNMRRLAETHRNEFAFYNGNRYIIIRHLFEAYMLKCMTTGNTEEFYDNETEAE